MVLGGVTVLIHSVKLRAISMLSIIYALLPLSLLLFSSVIRYILLLLVMVIGTLSFVSLFNSTNTLLMLVIMTVYVGAIITLFVYVSAVSPNDYVPLPQHPALRVLVFLMLSISLSLTMRDLSVSNYFASRVSSDIFTGAGVYLRVFLTRVLLLILLVSTYRTPSLSIFRSVR